MIGIAFIIFAALIGISQGFVEVGGLLVPQLITDMPTFFDYDETTGDMILDGSGNPAPNERIDLYWLLVSISVVILVINNKKILHARTKYNPNHPKNSRWLKRIFVKSIDSVNVPKNQIIDFNLDTLIK